MIGPSTLMPTKPRVFPCSKCISFRTMKNFLPTSCCLHIQPSRFCKTYLQSSADWLFGMQWPENEPLELSFAILLQLKPESFSEAMKAFKNSCEPMMPSAPGVNVPSGMSKTSSEKITRSFFAIRKSSCWLNC